MGFGISHNNQGTRSIGSKATTSATNKAANVAIGSNGSRVNDNPPMRGQRPLGSVKRSIHPGSRAGLNDHSTVHLQQNGTGYMNPSNQLARYSKTRPLFASKVNNVPYRSAVRPRLNDTRLCKSSNSTIAKLNKLI